MGLESDDPRAKKIEREQELRRSRAIARGEAGDRPRNTGGPVAKLFGAILVGFVLLLIVMAVVSFISAISQAW